MFSTRLSLLQRIFKLAMIDLNKEQALSAHPKSIQQIIFTGR